MTDFATMTNEQPTNEQIALLLDPQRKRKDWWTSTCPAYELGGDNTAYFDASDDVKYTGPDFYAAGVCAEEVEPELERQGCWWKRTRHTWTDWAAKYLTQVFLHSTKIASDNHHPTAINLALAKIKESDHA